MTQMQELILICISEYIYENEKTPTVRDIAYELEKSVSTIHFHMKKLINKGLITQDDKGRIVAICQK